jgi:hypothetical protein
MDSVLREKLDCEQRCHARTQDWGRESLVELEAVLGRK